MATKKGPTPLDHARELLRILHHDREEMLLRIDEYMRGIQDDPYMPENADDEYKLLAERAVTNVCPFIVKVPSQSMYVDSFRRGRSSRTNAGAAVGALAGFSADAVQPEWDHFQKSGMDAKQSAIYEGAFTFGHSFVLTEKTDKGARSKGLSALRTSALYEDPANDITPVWSLTVTRMPKPKDDLPGKARMWNERDEFEVEFEGFEDLKKGVKVKRLKAHGAQENPVTRFAASVDLEGRTLGVVWPMIALQNRINQTVFDLLIVQSYASFKVRTISGMAPPFKMKPIYEDVEGVQTIVAWEPEIGKDGRPIPANINLNAKRFLFAEDENTKFGTLDETPLDGFIKAIEMAFRHMAALSQTPPHHILGEIANLSAEALTAAETALSRKIESFKTMFGEAWERVFRVAAQIEEIEGAEDFSGEVLWRDMEQKSLAQSADALGKLGDQLGIPLRGLWARVPGVTANELAHWEDLRKSDDLEAGVAAARASRAGKTRPTFRESAQPDAAQAA